MIVSLFHQCYYSYLRGDLDNTKMFFTFLREEFKKRKDKNVLDKHQLNLLKKVKKALDLGTIATKDWASTDIPDTTLSIKMDKNHKEIVNAIYDSTRKLGEILSRSNEEFYLYSIEHPCPPYGRADMLYMDNTYAYPVEVKPGLGNHEIIGQIFKYDLYCRFQLHKRFYSDVIPITICGGYNKFVLGELKKMGVVTLIHRFSNNKMNFTKI